MALGGKLQEFWHKEMQMSSERRAKNMVCHLNLSLSFS